MLEGTARVAVGRCGVRLLGAVAWESDGVLLDVPGVRQRAVLARLALAPGVVVPVPELVAAVWDDDVPAGAVGTLRAHVSKLRALGVGDRLCAAAGGYRLEVDDDDVDARRFLALLAEARRDPQGGLEPLRAALAAWSGEALPGTGDSAAMRAAARDLEDARLEAAELSAGAHLQAGSPTQAVDLYRSVLRSSPTREAAAAGLVRALYAAGRQAEALDVYQDARRSLADALGIEPGEDLQRAQQEVLSQASVIAVPAQRSAPPAPAPCGNLPVPLTSFVGRDEELAGVTALLDRARLVTLTGAGGSGKTRLALELARRRPLGVVDGPWLVELAGLQDAGLLPAAVAEATGVSTPDRGGAVHGLVEALRDRRLLLVLDNCEHLADGVAALVEQLLAACPHLHVLATSREPLGVPGEQVSVVPALPVTGPGGDGDAVALFAQRARSADPGFRLDASTRALVHQVCRELDGIPLAIELAASRLSALPLQDVARLLDDRFSLLVSRNRTALPRHRTLSAAVQWSYDLLSPPEQALFRDVSVFRGGFALEAAADVAGSGRSLASIAAVLAALVDKSMVVAEPVERRYRVLETLRDFADKELTDERRTALQDRHRRWAADLAARTGGRLRTRDEHDARRTLSAERHNLRVALDRALAQAAHHDAVLIAAGMWWYWFVSGHISEGLRWTGRVVETCAGADRAALSDVWCGRAVLSHLNGDVEGSIAAARTALQLAERCNDPARLAEATTWSGYLLGLSGDQEAAAAVSAIGMATAAAHELPAHVRTDCFLTAAQVARGADRHDEARDLLVAARACATAGGDRWGAAAVDWVLGKLALHTGQPRSAADILAACARQAWENGDRTHVLVSLHHLAGALAELDRAEDGAALLGAVQAIGSRTGVDAESMIPAETTLVRQLVHRRLTAARHEAAVARGRALSLEQAVALGLDAVQKARRLAAVG